MKTVMESVSARDRILTRLRKTKALADNGAAGERDSAAALLQAVAAEHGIDLDDIADDETEREWQLPFKTGWRLALFSQLAALMRREMYGTAEAEKIQVFVRKSSSGRVRIIGAFVRCTASQWIELDAKRHVLELDYERHLKAFFRAFLERNNLLLPHEPGTSWPELSDEERRNAELALAMSYGMEKSVLRKQIEDAGEQDKGGGAE